MKTGFMFYVLRVKYCMKSNIELGVDTSGSGNREAVCTKSSNALNEKLRVTTIEKHGVRHLL
jgi:hypothetical protein